MSDVSEEALLDYFSSRGGNSGKVRNADLLKTFKPFIGHGDAQLRAKYREEFKLIIDRIAVVKSENGEKFLVLKKKYRQQLQERDARPQDSDGDGQRRLSPSRTEATAQWDSPNATTASPSQQHGRQDERTSRGEEQRTGGVATQLPPPPVVHIHVPSEPSTGEEELDKDSGSKSESEQDEEGTGSMGSAAVALDPIEKEWIYSAAGARVPDLSQLLRQDPSLANKKDFTSGFVSTSLAHHSSASPSSPGQRRAHGSLCRPSTPSPLQPPLPSLGSAGWGGVGGGHGRPRVMGQVGGSPPLGGERNVRLQEGKTQHPVRPRPSLLPTGGTRRAACQRALWPICLKM